MECFVTDYVVSHSVSRRRLQLAAHGIDGISLPEELGLLGNFAELCWIVPDLKYDVTVLIEPKMNLGETHERNGRG
jgi:hypothetical protein